MLDLLSGYKNKITPIKESSKFELNVTSPPINDTHNLHPNPIPITKLSENEQNENRFRLFASKRLPPIIITIIDDILFSGTMPKLQKYIKSFEYISINHNISTCNKQKFVYCIQNILYLTLHC